MSPPLSVVMIGATGAVGTEVVRVLSQMPVVDQVTLLGRRKIEEWSDPGISQHVIDVFDASSYRNTLPGHNTAICTLGVGQPSTMSREEFVKIDKQAVYDFAVECKKADVQHFQLLSSVGASSQSRYFFLKMKGELQDDLKALGFERLSLFEPSMILTDHNRYGWVQGMTLVVWPWLKPLLMGPLRKYRGIHVNRLGIAIARNTNVDVKGPETLRWDDMMGLSA